MTSKTTPLLALAIIIGFAGITYFLVNQNTTTPEESQDATILGANLNENNINMNNQNSNAAASAPETLPTDKLVNRTATIKTSKGDIVVELYGEVTPQTVSNFITLSSDSFYDGLLFHRVEPGFVIQGGDPMGTGQGGPGYTVPAEISSEVQHVKGALAMARLPDTVNPEKASSGSQFYITLNPTPFLDGEYTVFGQVTEGMDVVESIEIGDEIITIEVN